MVIVFAHTKMYQHTCTKNTYAALISHNLQRLNNNSSHTYENLRAVLRNGEKYPEMILKTWNAYTKNEATDRFLTLILKD